MFEEVRKRLLEIAREKALDDLGLLKPKLDFLQVALINRESTLDWVIKVRPYLIQLASDLLLYRLFYTKEER